ncbi:hypothetical protein CDAR_479241 [Caerostris darwini]|uniref:Uncharacterized protein n=1 Tax=Caerostris darwini TaxID=1538125 RepID=A0AAV4UWQ7_9ARAC|nr:hypothetical protein CDAR_479241 [Caerostris darwini]
MSVDVHNPLSLNAPLHVGYLYGKVECAEMLLKYEADRKIMEPHGIMSVRMEVLYRQKMDDDVHNPLRNINNLDHYNETHHVCWKGSIACTDLLLKLGVDIHSPQNGKILLHETYRYDQVECAEMQLESESNVIAVDIRRKTPLHVTCEYVSILCIELLLKMGADVNSSIALGTV